MGTPLLKNKFAAFAALLILWTQFASADVNVQVSEDATAKQITENPGAGTVTPITAGKPVTLELSAPLEITENGRIPVILVPTMGHQSLISLDPPQVKDLLAKRNDAQLDQALSSVMSRLSDIQDLIQAKAINQALQDLELLEGQHPNLKFLEFTRASILLIQGRREEAIRVAKLARIALPDYSEGRKFVEKLTGEKTTGDQR